MGPLLRYGFLLGAGLTAGVAGFFLATKKSKSVKKAAVGTLSCAMELKERAVDFAVGAKTKVASLKEEAEKTVTTLAREAKKNLAAKKIVSPKKSAPRKKTSTVKKKKSAAESTQ